MSISKSFNNTKKTYKVTFKLPIAQPSQTEVRVLGDFNNWNWESAPVLEQKKNELKTVVELHSGKKYEFRYLDGNGKWFNDESADDYVPAPYANIYNCVIDLPTKASTAKAKISNVVCDFRIIEGIGPKINQILQEKGITTFEELAQTPSTEIKEILLAAGSRYKMHDPTTWSMQADMVAQGKMEELAQWQQNLKGGRHIS